jgi:hypothetical protein
MKFELFHNIINTSLYFGDFNSRTAEEPDFIDFEINEHERDFTEFLQNDLATLNEIFCQFVLYFSF